MTMATLALSQISLNPDRVINLTGSQSPSFAHVNEINFSKILVGSGLIHNKISLISDYPRRE